MLGHNFYVITAVGGGFYISWVLAISHPIKSVRVRVNFLGETGFGGCGGWVPVLVVFDK
jgi:hypothetical protein